MGEFAVQGWRFLSLFSDLKPIYLRLFFFTAAVFLLYSGFPVLFPLDHNVVPFLKNIVHLHGPETAYFTRCSILWQIYWTQYAFNFYFKVVLSDLIHCCNCCISIRQADFADHLKLLDNGECICSDMVGVIGLIHRPMLRSHYSREFELQRDGGNRQ